MSDIDVRYIVEEGGRDNFNVVDQKEKRVICWCSLRKDAGMIAGVLNKTWTAIEQEDRAIEMGG